MPDLNFLIIVGFMLIILGFFLVALGMIRFVLEAEEEHPPYKGKVKGGGVILIGPIPVVFGTDKRYALILMVLAIALMLLAIIWLH